MPPLPTTRLTCHAPHPTTSIAGARVLCNYFLGYAPGALVFLDAARRAPERPDGDLWVRCDQCRAWNRFRALAESAA